MSARRRPAARRTRKAHVRVQRPSMSFWIIVTLLLVMYLHARGHQ